MSLFSVSTLGSGDRASTTPFDKAPPLGVERQVGGRWDGSVGSLGGPGTARGARSSEVVGCAAAPPSRHPVPVRPHPPNRPRLPLPRLGERAVSVWAVNARESAMGRQSAPLPVSLHHHARWGWNVLRAIRTRSVFPRPCGPPSRARRAMAAGSALSARAPRVSPGPAHPASPRVAAGAIAPDATKTEHFSDFVQGSFCRDAANGAAQEARGDVRGFDPPRAVSGAWTPREAPRDAARDALHRVGTPEHGSIDQTPGRGVGIAPPRGDTVGVEFESRPSAVARPRGSCAREDSERSPDGTRATDPRRWEDHGPMSRWRGAHRIEPNRGWRDSGCADVGQVGRGREEDEGRGDGDAGWGGAKSADSRVRDVSLLRDAGGDRGEGGDPRCGEGWPSGGWAAERDPRGMRRSLESEFYRAAAEWRGAEGDWAGEGVTGEQGGRGASLAAPLSRDLSCSIASSFGEGEWTGSGSREALAQSASVSSAAPLSRALPQGLLTEGRAESLLARSAPASHLGVDASHTFVLSQQGFAVSQQGFAVSQQGVAVSQQGLAVSDASCSPGLGSPTLFGHPHVGRDARDAEHAFGGGGQGGVGTGAFEPQEDSTVARGRCGETGFDGRWGDRGDRPSAHALASAPAQVAPVRPDRGGGAVAGPGDSTHGAGVCVGSGPLYFARGSVRDSWGSPRDGEFGQDAWDPVSTDLSPGTRSARPVGGAHLLDCERVVHARDDERGEASAALSSRPDGAVERCGGQGDGGARGHGAGAGDWRESAGHGLESSFGAREVNAQARESSDDMESVMTKNAPRLETAAKEPFEQRPEDVAIASSFRGTGAQEDDKTAEGCKGVISATDPAHRLHCHPYVPLGSSCADDASTKDARASSFPAFAAIAGPTASSTAPPPPPSTSALDGLPPPPTADSSRDSRAPSSVPEDSLRDLSEALRQMGLKQAALRAAVQRQAQSEARLRARRGGKAKGGLTGARGGPGDREEPEKEGISAFARSLHSFVALTSDQRSTSAERDGVTARSPSPPSPTSPPLSFSVAAPPSWYASRRDATGSGKREAPACRCEDRMERGEAGKDGWEVRTGIKSGEDGWQDGGERGKGEEAGELEDDLPLPPSPLPSPTSAPHHASSPPPIGSPDLVPDETWDQLFGDLLAVAGKRERQGGNEAPSEDEEKRMRDTKETDEPPWDAGNVPNSDDSLPLPLPACGEDPSVSAGFGALVSLEDLKGLDGLDGSAPASAFLSISRAPNREAAEGTTLCTFREATSDTPRPCTLGENAPDLAPSSALVEEPSLSDLVDKGGAEEPSGAQGQRSRSFAVRLSSSLGARSSAAGPARPSRCDGASSGFHFLTPPVPSDPGMPFSSASELLFPPPSPPRPSRHLVRRSSSSGGGASLQPVASARRPPIFLNRESATGQTPLEGSSESVPAPFRISSRPPSPPRPILPSPTQPPTFPPLYARPTSSEETFKGRLATQNDASASSGRAAPSLTPSNGSRSVPVPPLAHRKGAEDGEKAPPCPPRPSFPATAPPRVRTRSAPEGNEELGALRLELAMLRGVQDRAHVAFVGFIEAHRSAVRARTRAAREVSRLKKRVALLERELATSESARTSEVHELQEELLRVRRRANECS